MRFYPNYIGYTTMVRREIMRFLLWWPETLVSPAISMALYFAVFGRVLGSTIPSIHGYSYIQYIMPGLIMMSLINNVYANISNSVFMAKFMRSIEEILISPMNNVTIILGFVSGAIIRGVVVCLIVSSIALCFTRVPLHHLGMIIIVGILVATLFALCGLINAIFAKRFDDISMIPTFVLGPLTYLGGVFYSVSVLPPFWRNASLFNPILFMVNGFRYGFLGVSDVPIYTALTVISLLCVVLFGISWYLLDRGIGIKH